MPRVRRSDVTKIDVGNLTAEGYLDTEGSLTRTGVFTYFRPDGAPQRELRLPEHVFDPASLASFDGVPLTLGHPSTNLDAATAMRHAVGFVMQPHAHADGKHVRARIKVMAKDAIRAIESGVKELSNGYDTELEPIPGGVYRMPDGTEERADFIQTNIRGNHTALVPRGRAGATSRLDSAGHEDSKMDELEKAQAEIAALKVSQAKADAELATFRTEREAQAKSRQDELDRIRGENEALKTDAKKRMDAEAAERAAALAAKVAPILKRDVTDLIALPEQQLMVDTLKIVSPELKTDAWGIETVRGAFEVAMLAETRRVDSASQAALAVVGSSAVAAPTVDSYDKMRSDASETWKRPLGPS